MLSTVPPIRHAQQGAVDPEPAVPTKRAVAEAPVDIEPTDELSTPALLGSCEDCKEVNCEDAAEMVTCVTAAMASNVSTA